MTPIGDGPESRLLSEEFPMEEQFIECKQCNDLPPEMRGYMTRTCKLCGTLHCDECLNEAGLCTPCSERLPYSKEEATPV